MTQGHAVRRRLGFFRQIEDVGAISSTVNTELLSGLIKDVGGHAMIMVLNFEKLIQREFAQMAGIAKTTGAVGATSASAVDEEDEASEFPVAGYDQPTADATRHGGFDDTPIEELELGVRSYNCLKREGIETVGDLIAKSDQELMCIPNFGRKSIEEVRERLAKNNLKLRGE